MTIYVSPYETTAGQGFVTTKISQALVEAHIRTNFLDKNWKLEELEFKAAVPQPTIVTNRSPAEAELPYFSHPMLIDMGKLQHRAGESYMVADMRLYLGSNPNPNEDRLNIKNTTEFSIAKTRLVLSNWWAQGHLADFKYLSAMPLGVYSSWVSENCSRRFFLDPKDQHQLAILAAIYYQTLFQPAGELSEDEMRRMVPSIARATRADGEAVFTMLEAIREYVGSLDTLQQFCEAAQKILENPRLDQLNTGTLVTLLNTSWFGTNAKEIASVAIDHPPTFLSLVYGALTQRTYTASPMGRLCKPYLGNRGEAEFLKGMRYLMEKAS